jgi:hypothetical protein
MTNTSAHLTSRHETYRRFSVSISISNICAVVKINLSFFAASGCVWSGGKGRLILPRHETRPTLVGRCVLGPTFHRVKQDGSVRVVCGLSRATRASSIILLFLRRFWRLRVERRSICRLLSRMRHRAQKHYRRAASLRMKPPHHRRRHHQLKSQQPSQTQRP